MHGHGRVAEHGFGARRGDSHHAVGAFDGVANVPQARLDGFVINLVVADAGLELDVPVDKAFAAIDQAVLEEFEEGLPHSAGAGVVECEAFARPIAGAAQTPELFEDAVAVLLFPFPNALDEGFTADVDAGLVFLFLELFFDDGLGGNAGVVDAGNPERVEARHAVLADEDVLKRVVDGVAEMQGAGHVGRRHDDGERSTRPGRIGGEAVVLAPEFMRGRFDGGRIVVFGKVGTHGGNVPGGRDVGNGTIISPSEPT